MKPGDLIQSKADPDLIYVVLWEEVHPQDGMMNIVLLDLEGGTREWYSESIKKLYKVISETR